MTFLNYSLILLLRDDQASRNAADLRDQIIQEFGGGTSLQLPLHITLIRWLGSPSAELHRAYSNLKVDIRLHLTGPTACREHGAIWYNVAENSELDQLVDQCHHELVQSGKPAAEVERTQTYHLTLAYRDYSHSRIDAILEWIRRRGAPPSLELHGNSLVVCHAERPGGWQII